jgi:hypothetical protein
MELTIEKGKVFIDPKTFFPQGKRFRTIECIITNQGCWQVVSHKPAGSGYIYLLWTRHKHYKSFALHHLMYEYCFGKIPQGLCICHTCDNPRCINPEHLWLGTHADNRFDCINKNRQSKGEKHNPNAKLTNEQIKEIRSDKKSSQTALAEKYEVSCSTISNIKNFKTWVYLTQ